MVDWELIGNILIICMITLNSACIVAIVIKLSQPLQSQVKVVQETQSEGELHDFLIIAQRFAATHHYDFNDYNCINYSDDLGKVLDEVGIPYEEIRGCNDTACHRWLRMKLDFEPQSGFFVDYSQKYPEDQTVIKK